MTTFLSGAGPGSAAAAAERIGLTVSDEILDGGSAARVFHARSGDGTPLVLKVAVERPGLVDGHDVGAFLGKLRQIGCILAGDPRLAVRYLPVLHAVRGPGWAACTTPFYPSTDLAAPLRSSPDPTGFFALHTDLVNDLIVSGYGQTIVPADPRFVTDVLVARIPRRRALLAGHLPPDLLDADPLTINGIECVSPWRLLDSLVTDPPRWWSRIAPPRLMFPAHGDANTRNVLVGEDGLRLIDPRGSTDLWDPMYDLAKTLFSLTVWDPSLRLGGYGRRGDGGWAAGFRHPPFAGYHAAADGFLDHLSAIPDFSGLMSDDPHWRSRLLFTHALHVLAEAPCRLSDPKEKRDVSGSLLAPGDLARCHYLLGTLLLNDVVGRLNSETLDPAAHLALARQDPA